MATVQNLIDSIEVHIRDYDNTEITEARLQILINDAAREAGALGWAYPVTDATATLPATGSVAVPADVAWIQDLRLGANFDDIVERHYWWMGVVSDAPEIFMYPGWDNKHTAGEAKITGWKRPSTYTLVGDTVDVGLESFLIDRAAAHALRTMAAGTSELDRMRLNMSEIKMRDSQAFIEKIPEQYRVVPMARHVPLR